MKSRGICLAIWACVFPFVIAVPVAAQQAEKATVCQLLSDPAAWTHKLVEVTGLASHGFEDSGFSDPSCGGRYGGLWMEYGGKALTGTMSTASDLSRTRSEPVVAEGILVSLVEDAKFRRFDTLLHEGQGNVVHATVVARFFAGNKDHFGVKGRWGGYGHMGCCSLLLIQQVVNVDEHRPTEFAYADESAHLDHEGCEHYPTLGEEKNVLPQQKDAEDGTRAYAFTDPDKVAREQVREWAKAPDGTAVNAKRRASGQGYVVYDVSVHNSKKKYVVVVSKPYWLSFRATERDKVAWVVTAAAESCEKQPGV